jgi:hypothetical protein
MPEIMLVILLYSLIVITGGDPVYAGVPSGYSTGYSEA